jgi:SiaC family regulatory phosphoprotein
MDSIRLSPTIETPEIILDVAEGTLRVEGECYPENPIPFFQPIYAGLNNYLIEHEPNMVDAYIKLQYINSASTVCLRDLFVILQEAGLAGTDIRLVWAFDEDDDMMKDLGTDILEDFNYIKVTLQPLAS